MKVKSESEVAQSCPTLRDPMDCSLPGSSIHGLCQARVLEWGAIVIPVAIITVSSIHSHQLRRWHNFSAGTQTGIVIGTKSIVHSIAKRDHLYTSAFQQDYANLFPKGNMKISQFGQGLASSMKLFQIC